MKNWISKALSNRLIARIFGETVLVVNLTRRTWRIDDRFRGHVFGVKPEERIIVSFKETIVEEVRGIEFEENLEVRVDMAKEGSRDITKTFNPEIPKSMECKLDPDLLRQVEEADRHCDQVLRDHDRPVVESPVFRVGGPGSASEKLTETCGRCGARISIFNAAYIGPKNRESDQCDPAVDLETVCFRCETESERINRERKAQ